MRTEHLNYLLEIVRCNSINKASKTLHINQQHLSNIVTALEDELGTKIFERSHKGIALTANGQIILERAAHIAEEVGELQGLFRPDERRLFAEMTGELKVYSTLNINPAVLLETVEWVNSLFPQVNITISEINTVKIIEMVDADPLAIGLVSWHNPQMPLEIPPDSKVKYIHSLETPLVAIAAQDSSFCKKYKTISLKGLAKQDLVLYNPYDLADNIHYRLLSEAGETNIKYVLSNLNAFHRILNKGTCVTLGCESQVRHDSMNHFKAVTINDRIKVSLGLVINEEAKDYPLIMEFVKAYDKAHHFCYSSPPTSFNK